EWIMSDTVKPIKEGRSGLPELEPWDIAVLPCWEETTVEFATNDQFQTYVIHNGIPHDSNGIAEWCFEDRCGIINFARQVGIVLKAVPNKNNSETELFTPAKAASEGDATL